MSTGAEFGIVVNSEHQFCVWPMHRRLPLGWHFTGRTGTKAEMEMLLRLQFVDTVPATRVARNKRFRASLWTDTEGGSPMA